MPRPTLSPPSDLALGPRRLLSELAAIVGQEEAVQRCIELLAGGDPWRHADTVLYLGGRGGASMLEGGPWPPYWPRVWGARGLLYVWSEPAAGVVLAGLDDESWRVAEMCLKVSARRLLPAGDRAARLCAGDLPRVRSTALRTLGLTGDTEHVAAVVECLEDPDEDVRRSAARALDRLATRLDLPAGITAER